MTTGKNNDTRAQELAAQLEQMRTDLYQVVDDAILNIARACAGLEPAEFHDIVTSVFHPMRRDTAQTMAVATPAIATDAPSPDTAVEKPASSRHGRRPVWSDSSDNSLRLAYSRRHCAGRPIEPDLEAELIRRFPTYNAETQTFRGARPRKSRQSRPYKDLSTSDLMLKYHGAKINGNEIDDDLSRELARRYPSRYDAATRTLRDKKTSGKRKPLRELSDVTLKQMYYKMRHTGISDELNRELARRFSAYNSQTRTFADLRGGYHVATKAELDEYEQQQAAARRRAAAQTKKDAQPRAVATRKPQPTADTPAGANLVVTKKRVKMSPDGVYYDVFVNGQRILQNHIDTQIEVFLNGTVLGVHGRVTDIPNFPENPSWQIYDTNLKRRTFTQVNPFTKKSVYIKNVRRRGDDQLALEISNKLYIILELRRLNEKIFKIADTHTK